MEPKRNILFESFQRRLARHANGAVSVPTQHVVLWHGIALIASNGYSSRGGSRGGRRRVGQK